MTDIRQLFILGAIAVVLVAVPATTYLVKKQQEFRTRASGSQVALILNPPVATKQTNQTLDVAIVLDNIGFNITGIDFTLHFDSDLLDLTFTPSSTFNDKLINQTTSSTGTLRYVAVDTSKTFYGSDTVSIGTLHVTAKDVSGTANVGFVQVLATGIGYTVALPTGNHSIGRYTIVSGPTSTISITPTGISTSPSPIITPTVTLTTTPTPTIALTPTLTPIMTPVITISPTIVLSPTPTIQPASPTPSKPLGDANNDGKVDTTDFAIWKTEYLQEITTPSPKTADFNSDSKVDIVDFNIWRTSFVNQLITPTQ